MMDHHLLDIIHKTTEFVENHLLDETLCLDLISNHVCVSKFHLLRIWKGATGTGLMEYVRRRRIALSLGDLLESRKTLEYISWRYSFGCQRTYGRVFKSEFGVTPAQWRSRPVPLQVLDRFNSDFLRRASEGIVIHRRTSVLPAFSVAGLEYQVDIRDNRLNQTSKKLGTDFFLQHRQRIMQPLEKDVYIGFTRVPEPAEAYTYYMPSLPVGPASTVPEDMLLREIKAHRYGIFTYIGHHHPREISSLTLKDIWHQVFEVWMPTVEMKLKESFSFERIDYARCSSQYCECDLYYPIEPVQEAGHPGRKSLEYE
jgi:AraC family transcriptional regulator